MGGKDYDWGFQVGDFYMDLGIVNRSLGFFFYQGDCGRFVCVLFFVVGWGAGCIENLQFF